MSSSHYYSPLQFQIPTGLSFAIIVSVSIHMAIFLGIAIHSFISSTPSKLPAERIITTKLVKLGTKPRAKKLLPRLPSKSAPKNNAVAISTKSSPSKKSTDTSATPAHPQASLNSRIERISRMQNALSKISKHPDESGHPDGSRDGTVSSFTEAVLGNQYASKIQAAIMRNYTVPPFITPQVCKRLKTIILIKVGSHGAIVDSKLEQPSGNDMFDRAVIKAIKKTKELPPPPKEIAQRMFVDGVEIHAPCKH